MTSNNLLCWTASSWRPSACSHLCRSKSPGRLSPPANRVLRILRSFSFLQALASLVKKLHLFYFKWLVWKSWLFFVRKKSSPQTLPPNELTERNPSFVISGLLPITLLPFIEVFSLKHDQASKMSYLQNMAKVQFRNKDFWHSFSQGRWHSHPRWPGSQQRQQLFAPWWLQARKVLLRLCERLANVCSIFSISKGLRARIIFNWISIIYH